MVTNYNNSGGKAVIEQATNNTTSWIGIRNDNREIVCGQTFESPSEGDLEAIEVYSTLVTKPGKVELTLHHFDPQVRSWGPAIGSTSVDLNNSSNGKWTTFIIPGMHLIKGKSYGFKLKSSNAYVGIGEAAGSHQHPPFKNGQEWQFTRDNEKGKSFSYFSLAFRVGLRA